MVEVIPHFVVNQKQEYVMMDTKRHVQMLLCLQVRTPVLQLVKWVENLTSNATMARVLLQHAILSMRIVLAQIVVAWGVSNRNGVVTLVAVLNWQPPANLVEMDPLGMTQKERANQQN